MRFVKSLIFLFSSIVCRTTRSKILFYHDIGRKYTPMGTLSEIFWAHMGILDAENRNRCGTENRHRVCFDDGFRGIWDERLRLKYEIDKGLEVVVFVAIRLVGQPGYLTWEEIRALQNEFGVEFQCHTWSHQTLCGKMINESPIEERSEAWYRRELVESKIKLEEELNRKVDSLCFPVGHFSMDVIHRCQDAGYKDLYTSYPGDEEDGMGNPPLSISSESLCLHPRCLCQFLTPFQFKCVLRGGMDILYRHYFRKQYIVD